MARNNVWVISDTHFGHKNILSFKDKDTGDAIRGKVFSSIDEMDETLIDNWNRVVKPGDKIYHLGDFNSLFFIWPKYINGTID